MGDVRHVEKPAAKLKEKPEVKVLNPQPEEPWSEIGEAPVPGTPAPAPFDGRTYLVKAGEQVAEAVWRTTRKWDAKSSKFVPTALWSLANSGGQPLPFFPTHWRKFELVYTAA